MDLDFARVLPSFPFILQGIGVTLKIVGFAALLGFILGVILSIFKISSSKLLRGFANFYTSIFRGTPLVLQLMIIYFGLPQAFNFQITATFAAILAFGLNSGAYISEIIRAGIEAVDKGQTEAAMALGVSYPKMMRQIILPQAIKNILPALMNEFITLTKESAIVTTVGIMDIMRRAYQVGSDYYSFLEPLILAGLVYYCLVMILTVLGKMLEGWMKRSD